MEKIKNCTFAVKCNKDTSFSKSKQVDFPLLFVVKQNFINGIMEKHVESVELLETLLTFACAAEKFGERESNACLILLKSLLLAIIYSVKC